MNSFFSVPDSQYFRNADLVEWLLQALSNLTKSFNLIHSNNIFVPKTVDNTVNPDIIIQFKRKSMEIGFLLLTHDVVSYD